MSAIVYKKMNLFDAPKNSILIHACNTNGVWGAGVARAMKMKFPDAYLQYAELCRKKGASLVGTAQIIQCQDYIIVNLFTSVGFGPNVDSPDKILKQTESAIADLIQSLNQGRIPGEIYSVKINSGLFNVPWAGTENIIEKAMIGSGRIWTVCVF